jgi:hypothetical protein
VTSVLSTQAGDYVQPETNSANVEEEGIMLDIKKFAAGVIAGSAIAAAALMAFAAVASSGRNRVR